MTKHDNFLRLSKARMDKVVKGIQGIGKLSVKSNYTYSPDEAEMMIRTLQYEVGVIAKMFGVDSGYTEPTKPVDISPNALTGYDKEAIKEAYMMIAKDDNAYHFTRVFGLKKLRKVILGWKVE